MGRVRKVLAFVVVVGGTAYTGYHIYKKWRRHEVLVEVTETLQLPTSSSESFTDLSTPVEGTVRVKCNLRWCCTFKLALKGLTGGGNDGSSRAASLQAGSLSRPSRGRSLVAGGGGAGPNWEAVETNMIVDPLIYDQLGHLEFTPALYGDYLIAKYQAWPHDEYTCAASVKNCWLYPGGSPNSFLCSLELHIHETVGEVALSFILEKGAEVASVDNNKVGSWRKLDPRGTEYIWDVGNFAFDRGLTQTRGPMLVEPVLANTIRPGQKGGDMNSNNDSGVVEHHSSMVILPLSFVYTVPHRTGSSSTSMEMGSINAILPGVSLSYTTTHTASGLEVSRMKVVKGGPKPFRAAYHRTLHSQQIEVVPQL